MAKKKKNAGRKGRRLGAYGRKSSGPVGFICGSDRSPDRKKRSVEALRSGGSKDNICISGNDASTILNILKTLNDQPECASIYAPKSNPCSKDLLDKIKGQVCDWCEGQGWSISNMGEDADPCLDCKGTGRMRKKKVKTASRRKR